MVAVEAMPRLVACKCAASMACEPVSSIVEVSILGGTAQMTQRDTQALGTVDLLDVRTVVGPREEEQIEYQGGWLTRQDVLVSVPCRTWSRMCPDSIVTLEVVRGLDTGVGAHVDAKAKLAPGQRLRVAIPAFKEFLTKVEYFIRLFVLTPANGVAYKGQLPRFLHYCVSTSAHVRSLWSAVVGDPLLVQRCSQPISVAAATAALEIVMRKYLKSRLSTFLVNAGIVPETSASTALRTGLRAQYGKTVAPTVSMSANLPKPKRSRQSAGLVDPRYACLVAIINHFGKLVQRAGCERGLVGLFNEAHGITFARRHGDGAWVVTALPGQFKVDAVYGNVAVGDVVEKIEEVSSEPRGGRLGCREELKAGVDLGKPERCSQFPLLVHLLRPAATSSVAV